MTNGGCIRIIVLLGVPGSGKGTVAQYLRKNYNIVHFSTGNLLRNEVKSSTCIGKEIEKIISSGKLVDDNIVNKVLESNLLRVFKEGDSVILLDGYPRTVQQSLFLDAIDAGKLKSSIRVLELDVDSNVAISRIAGRVICSKCDSTFNSFELGGRLICTHCGGTLVKRADDNEEIVRRRLQEYVNATKPVSGCYVGRLTKIPGNETSEEVTRNVDEVLRGFGMEKKRGGD